MHPSRICAAIMRVPLPESAVAIAGGFDAFRIITSIYNDPGTPPVDRITPLTSASSFPYNITILGAAAPQWLVTIRVDARDKSGFWKTLSIERRTHYTPGKKRFFSLRGKGLQAGMSRGLPSSKISLPRVLCIASASMLCIMYDGGQLICSLEVPPWPFVHDCSLF